MPNILHGDVEPKEEVAREQAISELPRFHRFAYRTGELWRNRPDALTMHYYYIPVALAVGAFVVGTIDQEFHLHIAKTMAADHATPHEGFISRTFDGAVHEVGAQAEQVEK